MQHRIWAAAIAATASLPVQAAAPTISVSVSSNDRIGLDFSKSKGRSAGSAVLGMWSDDGALELGGFQDGALAGTPDTLERTAELVSGKAMKTRGVRFAATIHRKGPPEARGWTLGVEARQQRVSDIGAALGGAWRTAGDSRLSISGKLRF